MALPLGNSGQTTIAEMTQDGGRHTAAGWSKSTSQSLKETAAVLANIPGKAEIYRFLGREACARVIDLCYWRDRDAFPRLIGFDLDAVLPRRSWADLLRFLQATLPGWGWEVVMSVYRGPVWTCLLARRGAHIGEDDHFLEADLHSDITVNGLPVADTIELLGRTHVSDGVRWLDDVDAAVCAYLQPAIANSEVKARYGEAFERAQASAPDRVDALCLAALGIVPATKLRAVLAKEGRYSLRRRLLRAALRRRPLRTAAVMLQKLVDAAVMYWTPPGRLWTFSGPDGAGKTTVLSLLQPLAERRIVVAVDRLHSRPYFIPRLAVFLPQSRREEVLTVRQYEQRLGLLKSVARLMLLIADLQLGYWLKVRPDARARAFGGVRPLLSGLSCGSATSRYLLAILRAASLCTPCAAGPPSRLSHGVGRGDRNAQKRVVSRRSHTTDCALPRHRVNGSTGAHHRDRLPVAGGGREEDRGTSAR